MFSTTTETKPVVRIRTVEKIRRVVRTQTVTVESTSDETDGGRYAGLTCSEIGHSFSVEPGSDPEHDADGDGIACESY